MGKMVSSEEINSSLSPKVAHRLNQDIYTLMMNKMSGRADGALRAIDSRQGLEAWRMIWTFIGKRDRQSLREEYRKITNPAVLKKLSDVAFFIQLWENRMSEIAAVDRAEYSVGPQQRMSILKEIPPPDLRSWIDSEEAKGDLQTWEEMRDYCMNK